MAGDCRASQTIETVEKSMIGGRGTWRLTDTEDYFAGLLSGRLKWSSLASFEKDFPQAVASAALEDWSSDFFNSSYWL